MVMAVQPLPNTLIDVPHLLHFPPPIDPNLNLLFQCPSHLSFPTPHTLPPAEDPSPPRKRPRGDPLETDAEVDALLTLHFEGLRAALEEQGRRRLREALASAVRLAQRRLTEKDAEIEAARVRTAELESRVVQVATEGQIWFHVARNSEATAANLRAAIEKAEASAPPSSSDEESCCDGGGGEDERKTKTKTYTCKACGEGDVSVLVLPCRHLCLCSECDRTVDTCPICSCSKTRSLQVFLS